MKPVFEISRHSRPSEASRPVRQTSNRPITDWSFQATLPDLRGGTTPLRRISLRPAFHTLSQGFFSTEAEREFRIEGALFGLMVALAAWPIMLAVQAASVLIK
jgi:hypothetical protein